MHKGFLFLLAWLYCAGCYRSDDFRWTVKMFRSIDVTFSTKVIWGNNEFVMADSYKIQKSGDGKNWVEPLQNLGSQNIAWGNNQYVDVGGDIRVAPDAINWTIVLASVPAHLNDVVWGGSGFVAVGDNGTVMVSVDGVSWSIANSNTTDNLHLVRWGGGLYFAIGGQDYYNDKAYSSTNGQNWTSIALPQKSNEIFYYYDKKFYYYDVVFGKSGYVLASDIAVFFSTDGISWTTVLPDRGFKSVTWCDSSWQYVGVKDGGGWFDAPRIYTSTDGKIWYEHWNAKWGGDAEKVFYADSIVCHGESYVIGGKCKIALLHTAQYSCVMYSP
jgi:hypothetical protein